MAKIVGVTFTGMDEWTDVERMSALAERFPWAEWGILVSHSRQGLEPRYPGADWITRHAPALPYNMAVHLCGSLARNAAMARNNVFKRVVRLVPQVERVQINIASDTSGMDIRQADREAQDNGLSVIVQGRSFDVEMAQWPQSTVPLLYRSGGRGVFQPFVTPPEVMWSTTRSVGFAGGIGPDNIVAVAGIMAAMKMPNPVWLDMETHVRTDDRFDLDKVESVLTAAAPFIAE